MYPVLAPGTLVKPQVRGLTFHWLRVVEDPGPEHLPKRVVTLARTEPERADQWLKVRRDRVHADASRMSVFDAKPTPTTAAAQKRNDRRAARQPGQGGKMADTPLLARSGTPRSPYPHIAPQPGNGSVSSPVRHRGKQAQTKSLPASLQLAAKPNSSMPQRPQTSLQDH